jgi:hypothetical protein
MASTSQMQAIIERLKEVTKKKHPGINIMHKPKEPKEPKETKKPKKKAMH